MVNGFNTVFKNLRQIKISCNNTPTKIVTVSSPYLEDDGINSTLSIDRNSFCEVMFDEDTEHTSVIVSKHDFAVGIYLSTILSQRLEIKLIGSGSPVLIRAEMPNNAILQMALATLDDDTMDIEQPVDPNCMQSKATDDEPVITVPVIDRFTSKRISLNDHAIWDNDLRRTTAKMSA